jgi:hypothetical protein
MKDRAPGDSAAHPGGRSGRYCRSPA